MSVNIQYLSKESDILFCSITDANLGQLSKPGTVLEYAHPEDSKTPPTCQNWISFDWGIWSRSQKTWF